VSPPSDLPAEPRARVDPEKYRQLVKRFRGQFGHRLAELREARGFTSQAAFARHLKTIPPASRITQGMVSVWEAGESEPKASTVAALAQALGVQPGELFPSADADAKSRASKGKRPSRD
jgi:transcriptional regulator with XRE-family HTH domain